MMDQISSLIARGLISPDAANGLMQPISYWQNKGIQPPIIEGGGAGTRLGATTTREPLLGYSKPKPSANTNQRQEPEKISGAAFLHEGKIYSGPNHMIALDQARNAGIAGTDVIKNGKEGFVTDSGRFVDRKQAVDIANAADQWRGPIKPSNEELAYAREKGITREALKPLVRANENMTYGQFQKSVPRLDALNKLIEKKDFTPSLADGKMKFRSLTRDENQVINKIGYGRAPDVTFEMEQNDPASAWEKNVRYWRGLETPSKE